MFRKALSKVDLPTLGMPTTRTFSSLEMCAWSRAMSVRASEVNVRRVVRREGQLGQLGGAHGGQRTHDHFMQVFNISWSVPRGEYDSLVRKPGLHGSSEWLRKLMNDLSALDQRRATANRDRPRSPSQRPGRVCS